MWRLQVLLQYTCGRNNCALTRDQAIARWDKQQMSWNPPDFDETQIIGYTKGGKGKGKDKPTHREEGQTGEDVHMSEEDKGNGRATAPQGQAHTPDLREGALDAVLSDLAAGRQTSRSEGVKTKQAPQPSMTEIMAKHHAWVNREEEQRPHDRTEQASSSSRGITNTTMQTQHQGQERGMGVADLRSALPTLPRHQEEGQTHTTTAAAQRGKRTSPTTKEAHTSNSENYQDEGRY